MPPVSSSSSAAPAAAGPPDSAPPAAAAAAVGTPDIAHQAPVGLSSAVSKAGADPWLMILGDPSSASPRKVSHGSGGWPVPVRLGKGPIAPVTAFKNCCSATLRPSSAHSIVCGTHAKWISSFEAGNVGSARKSDRPSMQVVQAGVSSGDSPVLTPTVHIDHVLSVLRVGVVHAYDVRTVCYERGSHCHRRASVGKCDEELYNLICQIEYGTLTPAGADGGPACGLIRRCRARAQLGAASRPPL